MTTRLQYILYIHLMRILLIGLPLASVRRIKKCVTGRFSLLSLTCSGNQPKQGIRMPMSIPFFVSLRSHSGRTGWSSILEPICRSDRSYKHITLFVGLIHRRKKLVCEGLLLYGGRCESCAPSGVVVDRFAWWSELLWAPRAMMSSRLVTGTGYLASRPIRERATNCLRPEDPCEEDTIRNMGIHVYTCSLYLSTSSPILTSLKTQVLSWAPSRAIHGHREDWHAHDIWLTLLSVGLTLSEICACIQYT